MIVERLADSLFLEKGLQRVVQLLLRCLCGVHVRLECLERRCVQQTWRWLGQPMPKRRSDTNLLVPWEVVVIMSSQQDLSLKFLNLFCFVKADVLFGKRFSFVYLEESVRVPSFVPSLLRHRCWSWRLIMMFLKSVSRLPDFPPWKMTAMKPENAPSQERSTLSGQTQRCSDGAAGNNTHYPNRTIVLAPNIVVFFFDQYANTLLGSCNGLRSYQPTSCCCQGSAFLEWTIVVDGDVLFCSFASGSPKTLFLKQ